MDKTLKLRLFGHIVDKIYTAFPYICSIRRLQKHKNMLQMCFQNNFKNRESSIDKKQMHFSQNVPTIYIQKVFMKTH